jgi:Lon protease-like protein
MTVVPSEVAVFPLVGVVLLPEQRLPLHIFEPRYRAMIRDVVESTGYLIVCNAHPSPDSEVPRIERVATLGRIVAHQQLPDGRFNILVEGTMRVTLTELPFVAPYRRASVVPLDVPPTGEVAGVARMGLLSVMSQVMQMYRSRQSRFDFAPHPELPTPRLAMRLTDRFVADPVIRQRVLETTSDSERVSLVTQLLAQMLIEEGDVPTVGSA